MPDNALIECEDCGGTVSKRADCCPHCGAPTSDDGEFLSHLPTDVGRVRRVKPKRNVQRQRRESVDESGPSSRLLFPIVLSILGGGMLLGIGLILWKPSPPAKQISAANVNKELFLPAYRALESPLDSPTLASELQAISPSLKTDDERQLYQLFGTMLELRADRKNIDMYGRLIEQLKTRSADARKEMSKSNTLSARDIELNSAFCTFVDRIAAIDSRGGIITQCLENTDGPRGHIVGSIRQCAVKELAEKHGLATRSEDRFKVIDSKVLDSHITKIKNATMKQIKAVMDQ